MRQNTTDRINCLDDDMDIQLFYEEINNLKKENKILIDSKELLERELENIKNNNFNFIFNNSLLQEKIEIIEKSNK